EMVSGRRPFAAESAAATVSAILTREPPPIARYSTEAPAELQRIVGKALRKDREERYQTSNDILIDLKDLKQKLGFKERLELSAQRAPRDHAESASRGEAAEFQTTPLPAADTNKEAGMRMA